MDHYELVARFFHQHIEHASLSVDAIADVASNAAMQATEVLFDERKLFTCAAGVDSAAAILLTDLLRTGVLRERPALPVVELCARQAEPLDGAIGWLCQQLTALGQPGDMAVVFAAHLEPAAIDAIAATLDKRDVNALWIGTQGPGMSLVFPGADAPTRLSLCCASASCLAELIDLTAFGPMEDML